MTGYTYELVNRDLDFPDFAKLCARAFGALIMMREEPLDAKIPEKFEPGNYHKKEQEEKEKEFAFLSSLKTKEEKLKWTEEKLENLISSMKAINEKELLNHKKTQSRLKATLVQAEAWNPPSGDHVKFKEYMIDQLQSSIKSDDFYSNYYAAEQSRLEENLKKPMTYFKSYLADVKKKIEYHKTEYAEEVKRTDSRNRWIRQLVESLETK